MLAFWSWLFLLLLSSFCHGNQAIGVLLFGAQLFVLFLAIWIKSLNWALEKLSSIWSWLFLLFLSGFCDGNQAIWSSAEVIELGGLWKCSAWLFGGGCSFCSGVVFATETKLMEISYLEQVVSWLFGAVLEWLIWSSPVCFLSGFWNGFGNGAVSWLFGCEKLSLVIWSKLFLLFLSGFGNGIQVFEAQLLDSKLFGAQRR